MKNWCREEEFEEIDGNWLGHYVSHSLEINEEEKAFGFVRAVLPHPTAHYWMNPTHTTGVVAPLGDGLIAIKLISPDKSQLKYAIWNEETLRPEKESALDFAHLQRRFPNAGTHGT